MNRLLLTLLPALLAACASTPPKDVPLAADAAANDTVCERETRTGTALPTTRCRSAADRQAERRGVDAAAEATRNIRTAPPTKSGS